VATCFRRSGTPTRLHAHIVLLRAAEIGMEAFKLEARGERAYRTSPQTTCSVTAARMTLNRQSEPLL